MNCPVCNHPDIHELSTSCPNCRADLTSFVVLDSLEEDFIGLARSRAALEGKTSQLKEKHQEEVAVLKSRINKMWFLLLLLPLLHLLCYKTKANPVALPAHSTSTQLFGTDGVIGATTESDYPINVKR